MGAAGGGVGVDVDPAFEKERSGKYLQTVAFLSAEQPTDQGMEIVVLLVVGTYSISIEVQVFLGGV